MAFDRSQLTSDFGDPMGEAAACRNDCALFDFSFLEAARVQGKSATAIVEEFCNRSVAAMPQGSILYSVRVDAAGDACADLTVWRVGADVFEIMSGRREDIVELLGRSGPNAIVTDLSPHRAVFAVQGPCVLDTLRKVGVVEPLSDMSYFTFKTARLCGIPCTVGRLGYTGEAGLEIIVPRSAADTLWSELSQYSRPAGFIAADMLRIEAGFILFANEFRMPVLPVEAGLGTFFRPPPPRAPAFKLVAFRARPTTMILPWEPMSALQRPDQPGALTVTSACKSPIAGCTLGLGYVKRAASSVTALYDPTGIFEDIHLVSLPFYDPQKQRPRAAWKREAKHDSERGGS